MSQTEQLIERYARQADGSWRLTVSKGPEAVFELESAPCRLTLADVYFKVPFAIEDS